MLKQFFELLIKFSSKLAWQLKPKGPKTDTTRKVQCGLGTLSPEENSKCGSQQDCSLESSEAIGQAWKEISLEEVQSLAADCGVA